ncbi:hypothetical protein KUTeg_011112 [Tegillarca granosa]|uniref:Phosphate transporter n=1 Tax=Tegillarca granosa TaxID=220873 RepID=A0ABQ9F7B5_TEGGR|nr:hypothetical protein KUTeg_011112 [Tegillarca granosa]
MLKKPEPLIPGLKLMPLFYGITAAINLFSVFYKGSNLLHFDKIPLYGVFILTFGLAFIIAMFVKCVVVPRFAHRVVVTNKELTIVQEEENSACQNNLSGGVDPNREGEHFLEEEETKWFEMNCTGFDKKDTVNNNPYLKTRFIAARIFEGASDQEKQKKKEIAVIIEGDGSLMYIGNCNEEERTCEKEHKEIETTEKESKKKGRDQVQDKPETAKIFSFLQILTAVFGAFAHGGNDVSFVGPKGIAVNVRRRGYSGRIDCFRTPCDENTGRRFDKDNTFKINKNSDQRKYYERKIRTTHCKVGSVVCVGRVRSRENVDWKLFRNIIFAWIVTLPFTGLISAALVALLKLAL